MGSTSSSSVMMSLGALLVSALVVAIIVISWPPPRRDGASDDRSSDADPSDDGRADVGASNAGASPEGPPSPPANGYALVAQASNYEEFRRTFVLDNPTGDGQDPTGGKVDYSAPMLRKGSASLPKNRNGDVFWNDLPKENEQAFPYVSTARSEGGLRIRASSQLDAQDRAGSVRLMSRALFYGGLFVFDVSHLPVGCGVWPAIWLNGFIGAPDQYHGNETDASYRTDMMKLAARSRSHACGEASKQLVKLDARMSSFLGKPVTLAMWPGGGEIDVLEQTNFSPINLVSLHGGPGCEVTLEYPSEANEPVNYSGVDVPPWPEYYNYQKEGVRSACGATLLAAPKDWRGLFQPFSGCPDDPAYMTELTGGPLNAFGRPVCPAWSAYHAGNAQVSSESGGWGREFNASGGKITVVQWEPDQFLRIWSFPRSSVEALRKPRAPLSSAPEPSSWTGRLYERSLQVSYRFDASNATRCDFNFMGIIINLTFGGGWGAATMDQDCKISGQPATFDDYMKTCWRATPNEPGACSDKDPPAFYQEAFFHIQGIRVFQKPSDQIVWGRLGPEDA